MTEPSLEQRVQLTLRDFQSSELTDLIHDLWAERNEFAVELSHQARKNSQLVEGQDTLKARVAELTSLAEHRLNIIERIGQENEDLEARLAAPLDADVQKRIEMYREVAALFKVSDPQGAEWNAETAALIDRQARRISELESKEQSK